MLLKDLSKTVLNEDSKVISFDLFDTLIKRPVVEATDMFDIIGSRLKLDYFKDKRVIAERIVRKNVSYLQDEITIYMIYKKYKELFTTDYSVDQLVEAENTVFLDYCSPRKAIVSIFNEAVASGKHVIIVTDIYLDKAVIEMILENCNIRGYEKLYVSSNENATKASGRLYRKVFADYLKLDINKNEILHIGDNKKTDVEQAKKAGIKTQHILAPIEVFRSRTKYKELLSTNEKYGNNNFLIGYIAGELFDNPYEIIDKQSIFNGDLKLLGKIVLGPFLLSYVKWMIEDMKKKDIDTVCWIYRDGYMPQKIYEMLGECYGELPEQKIMYLSRNMRYYFGAFDKDGFIERMQDLRVDSEMSVRNFIKWRLSVDNEDEIKEAEKCFKEIGYEGLDDKIGNIDKYQGILKHLQAIYVKNSLPKAKSIKTYCERTLKDTGKLCIFDVGYRGSVCEHLYKYQGIASYGYQIFGRPVMKRINSHSGMYVCSYIEFGEAINKKTRIINTLIEQVISSMAEGTAYAYDEYNSVVLCDEPSFSKEIEAIQEGIIEFCNGFIGCFKHDLSNLDFEGYQFFNLLVEILCEPSRVDAKALGKIQFNESKFIKERNTNEYGVWAQSKLQEKGGEKETVKQQIVVEKEYIHKTYDQCLREVRQYRIDKICVWLSEIHLFKPLRFVYRFGLKLVGKKNHDEINRLNNLKQLENIFREATDRALSQFDRGKKYFFIGGDVAAFDKGSIQYHNEMKMRMDDLEIVIISGVPRLSYVETKKILPFPFTIIPKVAVAGQYDSKTDVKMTKDIRRFFKKNKELLLVLESIKDRYSDFGTNYPEALVYYTYQYLYTLFAIYKPCGAIMWNKYRTAYSIMNYVCMQTDTKPFYMEFGAVPGTFSVDAEGQMGESFPATHSEYFKQLPLNESEKKKNEDVMRFLKESRLNRNLQPISSEKERLLKLISNGKKTVFYAGQNDYESGLFPYTENTKKYHSPLFKTSDQACRFLACVCEKNNWNLIYKPHPIMVKSGKCREADLPKNIIYVSNIDINDVIDISDVTVTILSQTSYLSLIREKPVVMLGYTQLKGKGCTYEAYVKESIEDKISEALKKGYMSEQKENFYQHMAQLNKYYVYDDNLQREIRYGQTVDDLVEYIYKNLNR